MSGVSHAHRVAKFEIKPTSEQLAVIGQISERLRELWNMAVEAREAAYQQHLAGHYRELHAAQAAKDKVAIKAATAAVKDAKGHPEVTANASGFAQMKHLLTPLRRSDPAQTVVPRVYGNDCLRTLDGSWRSWYKLKKQGDPKARKPRVKPEGWFQEISCCDPKAIKTDAEYTWICIPSMKGDDKELLTFAIPPYQQEQLRGHPIRKVTLYRHRGRYWMSVAFQIELPDQQPLQLSGQTGNTTFIALGTTAIAVLAPPAEPGGVWREELIYVPRADRYWKPKIDKLDALMDKCRRPKGKKPTRKYLRLKAARAKMFRKLGDQQKLQQRQMAQRLLALGTHFVVTELVVRAKPGKLADNAKPERRGTQGFNWATQNTGWIANMVAWLKIKAVEKGGSVQSFKLEPPHPRGPFRERKFAMVRLLRERYLASQ